MSNENKQRMTNQRRVILEELRKSTSHPTADGLYRLVKKRLPRISLATIYRNLDLLTKSGLIKRLEYGSGQWRFDGDLSHHYHVRCVKCGSLDDISDLTFDELESNVNKGSDYDIIGHSLEFLGICPDCRTHNI